MKQVVQGVFVFVCRCSRSHACYYMNTRSLVVSLKRLFTLVKIKPHFQAWQTVTTHTQTQNTHIMFLQQTFFSLLTTVSRHVHV